MTHAETPTLQDYLNDPSLDHTLLRRAYDILQTDSELTGQAYARHPLKRRLGDSLARCCNTAFFIPNAIIRYQLKRQALTDDPREITYLQEHTIVQPTTYLPKHPTMYPDAREQEQALMDEHGATNPGQLKSILQDKGLTDPRITPFGHVLRRYSLDELPNSSGVTNRNNHLQMISPRIFTDTTFTKCIKKATDGDPVYQRLVSTAQLDWTQWGNWGMYSGLFRNSPDPRTYYAAETLYWHHQNFQADIRLAAKTVYNILTRQS